MDAFDFPFMHFNSHSFTFLMYFNLCNVKLNFNKNEMKFNINKMRFNKNELRFNKNKMRFNKMK